MGRWVKFRHDATRMARTEVAIGLVVLTAIGVLLALIAAVTLGFRQSTRLVNQLDRQSEQRLVANYIERQATTSIGQQKVQLTWDDAFKAVVLGRDMRWADTYLGEFLWSNFHYDRLYLVDGQGRLLRAWDNGRPVGEGDYAALGGRVRDELGVMARNRSVFGKQAGVRRLADTDWPVDAEGRVLTRWSRAMVRVGDRPAQMTIASIVPDTDMTMLRATPSHLVALRFIDGAFLAGMRSDLMLERVGAGVREPVGEQINRLPLASAEGVPVGWINWEFKARGTTISEAMQPVFIAFVCFLLALVGSGAAIVRVLNRTLVKLREREADAIDQARHDPMTGLPNRSYFIEMLKRRLDRITRQEGMSLCVAFFDLDHFKYVNDTLGHSAGDALVVQVAQRCRNRLHDGDVIARLGGDEFVVMRTTPATPDEIARLGREMMGIFAAPFKIDGRIIDVTASCGISWGPEQGTCSSDLLRHADIALFRAKQRGRARWRAFTDEMAQDMHRRREIEGELRKALQQDQLTLAYQPIVGADDGRIVGCEALLRWHHPELGDISPGLFVPIAEQAGLMNLLGWWTLGRVLQQRSAWPDLDVSINLSPLQLTAHAVFSKTSTC
jgi:diguanylate cyclase (GGDEF)-like protein